MRTRMEKTAAIQLILEVVEKENPKNVEELVEMVSKKNLGISKSSILKYVRELEAQDKITLMDEPASMRRMWFWIIIGLTVVTDVAAFLISEPSVLMPARWVAGFLFSFFVPGYCALKVLFPKREFDSVETVLLSVGLSLAILPLVGLMVNFVVGSIALPFIMFALSLLVFVLATTAYLKNGQGR